MHRLPVSYSGYNSETRSVKNSLDIFGQALLDYYKGNEDACLKVHSTEAEIYDMPASIYYRSAEHFYIDQIALSLCSGKVLDVGAGVGIHSLYLQNKGIEVTALEVSDKACIVMSNYGVKNIITDDIFQLESYSEYDTWLILGRSIGIVGNLERLSEFLLKAKLSLTTDGKIILNSTNGEKNLPVTRKLQFEYQGKLGQVVEWLDIDQVTLIRVAAEVGFDAEIVHVENDGNYLAVLRKTEL